MEKVFTEQGAQKLDSKADIGDEFNPNHTVIAVMGPTGSGKTTFINTASEGTLRVGYGLESCTTSVETSPPFIIDGRSVVLIDTPGFDDTTKTDTEILSMISVFLAEMYKGDKKLAGIIYLHRISDVRMGGISARNFRMFRKLCGEVSLRNVVIATTRWSEVPFEVAGAREKELMERDIFFKPVLDRGATMARYDNTVESAHSILRMMIQNKPLPLLIQTEIVDEKKNLAQTAAGAEVRGNDIRLLIARHKQDMRELRRKMKKKMKRSERRLREQSARRIRQLKQELARHSEQEHCIDKTCTWKLFQLPHVIFGRGVIPFQIELSQLESFMQHDRTDTRSEPSSPWEPI